jgi:hypothetical protein
VSKPAWRVAGNPIYHKGTRRWEIRCFEDGKPKSYYRRTKPAIEREAKRLAGRYADILSGKLKPRAPRKAKPKTKPEDVLPRPDEPEQVPLLEVGGEDAFVAELLAAARVARADGDTLRVAKLAQEALRYRQAMLKLEAEKVELEAMKDRDVTGFEGLTDEELCNVLIPILNEAAFRLGAQMALDERGQLSMTSGRDARTISRS